MAGAAMTAEGWDPMVLIPGCAFFLVALMDRVFFAASVVRKQRDVTAALLPLVHLFRNMVWCWALAEWYSRCLVRPNGL